MIIFRRSDTIQRITAVPVRVPGPVRSVQQERHLFSLARLRNVHHLARNEEALQVRGLESALEGLVLRSGERWTCLHALLQSYNPTTNDTSTEAPAAGVSGSLTCHYMPMPYSVPG